MRPGPTMADIGSLEARRLKLIERVLHIDAQIAELRERQEIMYHEICWLEDSA